MTRTTSNNNPISQLSEFRFNNEFFLRWIMTNPAEVWNTIPFEFIKLRGNKFGLEELVRVIQACLDVYPKDILYTSYLKQKPFVTCELHRLEDGTIFSIFLTYRKQNQRVTTIGSIVEIWFKDLEKLKNLIGDNYSVGPLRALDEKEEPHTVGIYFSSSLTKEQHSTAYLNIFLHGVFAEYKPNV